MNKKTKILTLILFGSLICNLSAQEETFKEDPVVNLQNDSRWFRMGLHFSPNISWLGLNTAKYYEDGARVGFAYGISTEFFIAKNYLFSTGFNINNIGGNLKYEGVYDNAGIDTSSSVKQYIKINYVNIPLTLKLRTNEIGYMTYYGNFGFVLGFRYNSKTDYEYVDLNSIKKTDIDNTSNISFLNMDLVIGGGAEYNLGGNTNIMFGVSYHNGFVHVMKDKTNVLNTIGKATIDNNGKAVYNDKKVSATLNYFSLDLGIYF